MGKKRRFKIEPWIEAVVHNYGQQESAKAVDGYVLQVCDLSTSDQQEENAVALLSISDGMVQIPTVLSRQAWEVMQKNEERVSVSGLKNSTVVLHQYSLGFQKEAEMSKSKFFIAVNRLAAQAWGAKIEKVPCCTTLPTVRQKICETWRSLEEENPSTTMDTQSGFCLTELLVEWGENCLNDLLEELKGLLAQGPSSSSPQPSTSHAEPLPAAFPTGWHADRVRYRGQETFTVAVSHLYIPAEQMEKMQAQLDNPVTGTANPVEHEEERLGSLPDSGQDGNSLVCSGEEAAVVPVNPWDIFAPAVGNISTSSSEVSPSGSFVSALLPLDQALCDPMATSTPAFGATLERPCSRELFTSSDQSGEGVAATSADLPEETEGAQCYAPSADHPEETEGAQCHAASADHPEETEGAQCHAPSVDHPEETEGAQCYAPSVDHPEETEGAQCYAPSVDHPEETEGVQCHAASADHPEETEGAQCHAPSADHPEETEGAQCYAPSVDHPEETEGAQCHAPSVDHPEETEGAPCHAPSVDHPEETEGAQCHAASVDLPEETEGAQCHAPSVDHPEETEGAQCHAPSVDHPEETEGAQCHAPSADHPEETEGQRCRPSFLRDLPSGSDNQTLPPYQRPHPYLTTGSSPILAGSAQSSLGSFVSSANILQHRPSLLLCTPDPCQDKPTAHQQPSSLRRARSELTKTKEVVVVSDDNEEERGEQKDGGSGGPSQSSSPPSWLFYTPQAWLFHTPQAGSSKKCTNVHSAVRTHPDGTPFSYQYQPTPSVAKALSLFEVPDDHVRWAMRYLVSDRSKKPS